MSDLGTLGVSIQMVVCGDGGDEKGCNYHT